MAGVGTGMAAAFPEVVDLSDTALEDPGEVDALDEAVESVNLAFNALPAIPPAVSQLQHLTYLNFAHNDVDDLSPLSAASALRVLRASHNRVTSLLPLAGCAALEEAWLDHNRVAHLADIDVFKGCSHLSRLLLHSNPCLKTISAEQSRTILMVELPQVQQLSVSDDIFTVTESSRSVAVAASRKNGYLVLVRQLRAEADAAAEAAAAESGTATSGSFRRKKRGVGVPKAPRARGTSRGASPSLPSPGDSSPSAGESGKLETFGVESEEKRSADAKKVRSKRPTGRSPSPAGGSSDSRAKTDADVPLSDAVDGATLSSAVSGLPVFDDAKPKATRGAAQRAGQRGGPAKGQRRAKRGGASASASSAGSGGAGGSAPASSTVVVSRPPPKEVWSLPYPSGATGVVVTDDGGAAAKWPNGALAVSVDAEVVKAGGDDASLTTRYRLMASARDTGRALIHFDGQGGGDVTTAASTTLLSVTSDGSGFQCDSKGELLMRWDEDGRIVYVNTNAVARQRKKRSTSAASVGADDGDVGTVGDLASPIEARVSKEIGVQYSPATRELLVYFEYNGLKHCFVRGENVAGENVAADTNLFGRAKRAKATAAMSVSDSHSTLPSGDVLDDTPSASHSDRLSAIRAAVGDL